MLRLIKKMIVISLLLCGCATATEKEAPPESNTLEYRKFSFGGLPLFIPDKKEKDRYYCAKDKAEYIENKYICREFKVDGQVLFEGAYRKVKGEIAESGLFLDKAEPELILDVKFLDIFRFNEEAYILAIEYDYHDTLSVLYQLSVLRGKVQLRKINTYDGGPYNGIYNVPSGVIYSGYNIKTMSPWALYFDGEAVQELDFLGEPDEIILWNPESEGGSDDFSEELRTY